MPIADMKEIKSFVKRHILVNAGSRIQIQTIWFESIVSYSALLTLMYTETAELQLCCLQHTWIPQFFIILILTRSGRSKTSSNKQLKNQVEKNNVLPNTHTALTHMNLPPKRFIFPVQCRIV